MACEVFSIPGAVFALWGKPTVADLERVWNALQAATDACGHPVLYVTRIPVNSPPPDAAARVRLDAMMPRISQVCSSYHVVLEGEGFGAALKRGILLGLFQLCWRQKTFFVHATVEEVFDHLPPELRPVAHAIVQAARARGLLVGPPLVSVPPAQPQPARR